MRLSIIIPVYHEEKNIEKMIKQIESTVNTPHEILIIYDTKRDPTYPVLKKLLPQYKNIKLIESEIGIYPSVANKFKMGISNAKEEIIAVVMADLSDETSLIDRMVNLIDKGYDIVCPSRYMKGGKKMGGPLIKPLLSKLAGFSLYYLFKIPTHDATNAFKMYRKSLFKTIRIESTNGFEYSLEIILKAHRLGYKIIEIPTTWRDRTEGKSHFKLLRWLPRYISTYLLVLKPRLGNKNQ